MRSWPLVALLFLGLGLPALVPAHAQRGSGAAHAGFSSPHTGGSAFGSHSGSFGPGSRPAFGGTASRPAFGEQRFGAPSSRFASPGARFAPNGLRTTSPFFRGPSPTRPQFFTANRNGFGLSRNGYGHNGYRDRYSSFGLRNYGFVGYDPFLFNDPFLYPFWDDGFDSSWNDGTWNGPAAPDPNTLAYNAAPPQPDPTIAYPASNPTLVPQSQPDEEDALTLVFKDGRPTEQIHNYALTRTTLYVTGRHTREIPLDQLDLPATERINRAAGIAFQLP